jgi:L-2-hydroxyglutarate oxidase
MQKIIVIGGGIVGLSVAYKLGQKFPHSKITVLEKESEVCKHQSGNNSGVLHAGLYYKPGSSKARLAVSGIREMVVFCEANQIPHEICGKLVVATEENEIPRLKNLLERGTQNGLKGLQWLEPAEMKKIEPHVRGVAAIRVPEEGIVDYPQVCSVLVSKIREQNGEVLTGTEVVKLINRSNGWSIQTTAGDHDADFIINCAGLYCDKIAEAAGEKREARIIPFRGEYYKIKPERQFLVRNLIYPVPDPVYPFLGVHFTRLIHGGIEAGPNAVLALAREAYRKTQINLFDLADILTFGGFWKFIGSHLNMCIEEGIRSLSKRLFCKSLQKLIPEIRPEDLTTGGAGIRAQAMTPDGTLVQDFLIIKKPHALHVLNAPSPAATASLAIADEIVSGIKN